jgi:hypothetical protein
MCTCTRKIKLCEKITTSLHHNLNPVPELLADLGHGGPRKDGHHLHDLSHQQVSAGVVGGGGALFRSSLQKAAILEGQRATVFEQAAWA